MDTHAHYPGFKKLIGRLCETLGKPLTDELLESWWKALKHCSYQDVEKRVDVFLARAGEKTPFPRPSQMRDPDDAPTNTQDGNAPRDYWRTCVVNDVARALGHTTSSLSPILAANKDTLGGAMRTLLDELYGQEMQRGERTHGMHLGCQRRANEIARAFAHLRTEHAPPLTAPPSLTLDEQEAFT